MGEWKGIKAYEKPFELYNIRTDNSEANNVADVHPGIVKKISEFMIATRTPSEEFPLTKRQPHYPKD